MLNKERIGSVRHWLSARSLYSLALCDTLTSDDITVGSRVVAEVGGQHAVSIACNWLREASGQLRPAEAPSRICSLVRRALTILYEISHSLLQQLGADAVTLAVEILLELISSQLGQQTLAQDIRHAAHIAASEVSRIGEPAHYFAARIVECVESNQSVLKEGAQGDVNASRALHFSKSIRRQLLAPLLQALAGLGGSVVEEFECRQLSANDMSALKCSLTRHTCLHAQVII